MKHHIYITIIFSLCFLLGKAQEKDSSGKVWEVEASALWYIVPDDQFVLPIVSANRGKLHLESRYNYEDRNTFSLFAGYNFTGGRKLTYTLTPMLGMAVGTLDGILPGLEATLNLGKFELYSEMEYLFEFNDKANSYYYNWTELNFYLRDWLWFGISGQRTRAYQSALDIQRGILVGGSWKRLGLTGYLFNPWTEDSFGIISLSCTF